MMASGGLLHDPFGWDILTHPPYSPDLAPLDYHLFTKMEEGLVGQRFRNDKEVEDAVNNWTKGVAGRFYAEDVSKFVSRDSSRRRCL